MPTVPTYDSLTTKLSPTQNVQQSTIATDAVFAGNAQQLADASKGLNNLSVVIQKQEEERDTAVALNAETTSREAYLEFQNEARSRRGLAADGLVKDAEKWWEEQAQTRTEGMTDKQRTLYIQRMRGTRTATLESMAGYQDGQVRTAKQEGAQASMASAITLAVADPSNKSLFNDALRMIQATSSKLGAENGDAPEKVAVDMLTRTSTLHSGILDGMIDANPAMAREYLNTYGAQMTATARGQVIKTLDISERNNKVYSSVDDVMMTAADETEALKAVRKQFSGDAEGLKMAVAEVKTRYEERSESDKQRSDVAFDRAWKMAIDSGKGRRAIDAATWDAMTPQQRNSIVDELYQLSERGRVASDRKKKADTDAQWNNYYSLIDMADKTPNEFKQLDLRQYLNKVPPGQRASLINLQTKDDKELKDVTAFQKQLTLTTGNLNLSDNQKYEFESAARDAVARQQEATGKLVPEKDRQDIMDGLLIKGSVDGSGWFNDSQTLYEVYGTPDANKFLPEDPVLIKGFNQRKGRDPTSTELDAIKNKILGVENTPDQYAL